MLPPAANSAAPRAQIPWRRPGCGRSWRTRWDGAPALPGWTTPRTGTPPRASTWQPCRHRYRWSWGLRRRNSFTARVMATETGASAGVGGRGVLLLNDAKAPSSRGTCFSVSRPSRLISLQHVVHPVLRQHAAVEIQDVLAGNGVDVGDVGLRLGGLERRVGRLEQRVALPAELLVQRICIRT